MIQYENDCVGCSERFPCVWKNCSLRHHPHMYCDKCGEEADKLYYWEDIELCLDCIEKRLEVVKIDSCMSSDF